MLVTTVHSTRKYDTSYSRTVHPRVPTVQYTIALHYCTVHYCTVHYCTELYCPALLYVIRGLFFA